MAARSGSFGTSLSPFGTGGGLGNLSAYSIGDNLKDLEAYRLEIAWGNGQITDAEYQASLAKLAAAADPNTQAQLSAQNKLEDVTYRIGRSEADAQGLDALIAFDQQALSGMDSGNLRYRDVKSTLDSEMAQRRSRDYGKIVDDYNDGKTSTESLLAWVQNTIASLPGDAPDKDNWDSVVSSLTDRLVTEKDAQVYQDYQDRKLSPADFLAYLTGRRDAYDPSSPKYADADRRLADATKNVKDAAQAKIDQDVANRYNDGKISDHTYLVWLGKRVANLAANDPSRPDWEHRLTQTAHSLAEDKLRTDVSLAKTQTGQDTAKKALRDFYKAYAVTLNPGSAEYRSTMVSINSLTPAPKAKATGGGGGGSTGTGVAGTLKLLPKVISPTSNIDTLISAITPNAGAPKKNQATAVVYLRLNLGHATDALAAGDKEWVFVNPAYPGQTVAAHNPDGSVYHDKSGKTVQVPGSAYLPTTSQAVSDMQNATAVYSYALAGIALAKGDSKGYATALDHASNAETAARNTTAHAIQRDLTPKLDALQQGIDRATMLNDPATALALLLAQKAAIKDALGNPSLSDGLRTTLQNKNDAIDNNPLTPKFAEDLDGNMVLGPDGQPKQIGGAVDFLNSPRDASGNPVSAAGVYMPDYHFMLDTNSKGEPKWGPVLDQGAPGTWGTNPDGTPNHVQVQSGALGQIVVGEVKVQNKAPITPNISFTDQNGMQHIVPYTGGAQYIAYTEPDGNHVTAYSIDSGASWVQTTGGVLPVLQLNVPVTWTEDAKTGKVTVTDDQGHALFEGTVGWKGNVVWKNAVADAALTGAVSWWGQVAASDPNTLGDPVFGVTTGAPFQHFRITTSALGENGLPSLNFIPTQILTTIAYQDYRRGERATLTMPAGPFAVRTAAEGRAPSAQLPPPTAVKSAAEGRAPSYPVPTPAGTAGGGSWDANQLYRQGERASLATAPTLLSPQHAGIVAIGSPTLPPVRPPQSLPPAYVSPIVGFTLPALTLPTLKPVTLTPPPKPVVIAKSSSGGPAIVVAPSGSKKVVATPAPAKAPAPTAPKSGLIIKKV